MVFESIERFNHVEIYAAVSAGNVIVRDAETNEIKFVIPKSRVVPFHKSFRGEFHVATGDVNGDGLPDLLTVPGAGRSLGLKVFSGTPDAAGNYPAAMLGSFDAFPKAFKGGGLYVSVGDVNGDGVNDVAVSSGLGWLPQVRIFDGRTLLSSHSLLGAFNAFRKQLHGGPRVILADLDNDGCAEILVGSGRGPTAKMRIFNGRTFQLIKAYQPFGKKFKGGIFLAFGDVDGDGQREIIATADAGWLPMVGIWKNGSDKPMSYFMPFSKKTRTGVRVIAKPVDGGEPGFIEKTELMVSSGPNGGRASQRIVHASLDGQLHPTLVDTVFEGTNFNGIQLG